MSGISTNIDFSTYPDGFRPRVTLQKRYDESEYITTHLRLSDEVVLFVRPEQLAALKREIQVAERGVAALMIDEIDAEIVRAGAEA